ncbi:glutamyl-tRNA(Gln) amidotransferase subunit A, mitochondrial-like [Chelonus insularis]|uniref:glutamyl-tRNA(Gln) amidotransferase subunit A, mitochondrial-like n=1 Tax=Chelonus insularis TaxID=460826 RepID=UPI001589A365|nr:glutamyl-tRNA(Gln) amidotransferase subunit A, mitochondrial-like [Chelonus insularis]
MNKILSAPIKQVSAKIASGELLPSEICQSTLTLISLIKPLNAYIHVVDEIAKEQAKESDQRQRDRKLLSDLDGIPIAIKDNFCTEDIPTTCGSLMLANFVPGYNATVYERLRTNGAVLMGKTNLDQFAMGAGTVDSYFGPTKNIWRSDIMCNYTSANSFCSEKLQKCRHLHDDWFIAGGSSGGSAVAVASGTCYAALGSDTGGSTRNPAAYCGLVGFKPSYGLLSRHGLIPLVNSMDVPGILTRNIDDCILVFNAIAGPDLLDSTTLDKEFNPVKLEDSSSLNITGLKIGIPKEYHLPELDQDIAECLKKVSNLLEQAGASVIPVSLPHTKYSIVCYSVLNQCEVASNMARYDGIEYGFRADESSSTEELYAKTRSLGFNDVVRSRILTGNYFLLEDNYEDYFVKAMKIRRLIAEDFDNVWNSNIDILLTPTTLSDAPLYKDFISIDNQTQCSVQDYCTQPANMAGIPAINVPITLSSKGLPLSLQLMAPFLHEEQLFRVAKWIETAVEFPRIELKDERLLQ